MKRINCAIYTRKSSDDGLEQEFNSLDAQREACDAYIESQKHEGWICLPDLYDDGGLSGGTMERPALRRLLAEIESGCVKVVVVYKVDRLTRSLADFARIVDVLDTAGASFVSVTQQFNTTTSMGRLTLNMLLSFAQFEREIAGERIRDKIAASKARGMWMGGTVPLGYETVEKKLVINKSQATVVRTIFKRYLALGSVSHLKRELDAKGIVGRKPQGATRPSTQFGRGALYMLLSNPIYRGQIRHRDNIFAGQHDAIIDQDLWDQVQAKLAENRRKRRSGEHARSPSLLTGIVFDADGNRMTATHANKSGRRYRYYVTSDLITDKRSAAPSAMRVPAGDLEKLILDRMRALLSCREEVASALQHLALSAALLDAIWHAQTDLVERLSVAGARAHMETVRELIVRIDVGPKATRVQVDRHALASQLGIDVDRAMTEGAEPLTIEIDASLRKAGRGKRLVLGGAVADRRNDELIGLLARANAAQQNFLSGDFESLEQMARDSGRARSYLTRLIRLSYLAPDVIQTILDGRHPVELTVKSLMATAKDLPHCWDQQRKMLGINLVEGHR
ncbi:MAG: recombinase family protein [Alphaproteobacteria bacterium]|nr:recombinase family protein [Alphaproteobacteria bacterium]